MVGRTLDGFACTNNMVRLVPHDAARGRLHLRRLVERTRHSVAQAEAAGSSIPHLDAGRIAAVEIPWPDPDIRAEIADLAHESCECWIERMNWKCKPIRNS